MIDFFLGVFWFLVATFILVVGHEWGHFWVARKLGIRTLRFSVGFGSSPLWQRTGADGTQYWLSPIPLGGYVKFVDAESKEAQAGARPFLDEAVWKRMLVVVAGPLVNLVLAVVFLWAMFMVGVGDYLPIVGQAKGAAAAAGVEEGDRIVAVEEQPVGSWTEALIALVDHSFDREALQLKVEGAAGPRTLQLSLRDIPQDRDEAKLLDYLGLHTVFDDLPALIGEVTPGSPAALAGIQPGDRMLTLNGDPASRDSEFRAALNKHGAASDGKVQLEVRRAGQVLALPLQARLETTEAGARVWRIGVRWQFDPSLYQTVYRYSAAEALPAALGFIRQVSYNSVHMLYRMVRGEASTRNLSGPVTIARAAKSAAEQGLPYFLRILGLVSLSLFILNLLPLPILDGGQLLYYLIEAIKGRPLSERAQVAGQYVGLAAIFGLASIALYNDLARLFVPH